MKKNIILGSVLIILGLLIAVGPQTIFPVCGAKATTDSSQSMSENMNMFSEGNAGAAAMSPKKMACNYTAKAELGAGGFIAILGVLFLILKDDKTRLGIGIASALQGILVILYPTVLMGVCGSVHMGCNAVTRPALVILGVITLLISGYAIVSYQKK